jgi:hypothetical protein
MVVLLAAAFMGVAVGCHVRHKHADGVHAVIDDEKVCLEVETDDIDGSTDFSTARSLLQDVLQNPWGWASESTLNFVVAGVQCSMTTNRAEWEIEFYVRDDGAYQCDYVCMNYVDECYVHGDEHDYCKLKVYFTALEVDGEQYDWEQNVNHEFGHVVGFADPTPQPPAAKSNEHCTQIIHPVDNNGDTVVDNPLRSVPIISIMHTGGYCPQRLNWPSFYDHVAFELYVQ